MRYPDLAPKDVDAPPDDADGIIAGVAGVGDDVGEWGGSWGVGRGDRLGGGGQGEIRYCGFIVFIHSCRKKSVY